MARRDLTANLYAGEPEGFIAARDALVATLRAKGDDEEATAVKRLRKPTVAAWAVDAASRAEPKLVDRLLSAGERLAGVQRKAVSGARGGDELRKATEERRELIRRLTDVAVDRLVKAGRPAANARDEIAGTFEAATLDPAVADRVKRGVLDRTVKPAGGLGVLEGFTVLEGGAAASPPKERSAAERRRDAAKAEREADKAAAAADTAAERARQARAAADEAARAADELASAAHAADREARRLAAEAKTARTRADRAARQLEH